MESLWKEIIEFFYQLDQIIKILSPWIFTVLMILIVGLIVQLKGERRKYHELEEKKIEEILGI